MTRRHQGRECALQILYQLDLDPSGLDAALRAFWGSFAFQGSVRRFAEQLVRGVLEHRADLDQAIGAVSPRWRLARMAPVDRNILRLGAFELLHSDTPPAVVIDEAVELAKRFGAEGSPAFVNGLLDQLRRDRPAAGR